MSDESFLMLVDSAAVGASSDVKSPELTGDEWFPLDQIDFGPARELLAQRVAETRRIAEEVVRRTEITTENRNRIRRLIRDAISDRVLSSSERSSINNFASRAGISSNEVSEILKCEGTQILRQLVDDAIDDGILEPSEERQISEFARGLGIKLGIDVSRRRLLSLSKYAWQLNHSSWEEMPRVPVDVPLTNGESCLGRADVNWGEIVALKRPQGIPLGEGRYLKSIGDGICYVTNKRLIFLSRVEARRATLASVQQVSMYADGVLLRRATGKSLFLRYLSDDGDSLRFAMLVGWSVAGVVQARFIDHAFVPETAGNGPAAANVPTAALVDEPEPRFTFRVVGDFVGDRSLLISQLSVCEPLQLIREPTNQHDTKAVKVLNSSGKMLGYLKRDVADWFAPRMDAGVVPTAVVHRIRDDGALIVGVYE